ncbi:MAG: hypothetical protein HQK54_08735 [Oligoflexales bacterium]|nr:hypothetical protein [Oligoflexales bacterium]
MNNLPVRKNPRFLVLLSIIGIGALFTSSCNNPFSPGSSGNMDKGFAASSKSGESRLAGDSNTGATDENVTYHTESSGGSCVQPDCGNEINGDWQNRVPGKLSKETDKRSKENSGDNRDDIDKDNVTESGGGSQDFRTQTQGGWGTKAAGNNPGSYRDQHFKEAFPDGLKIGCDTGYTAVFTTSSAIQSFLPAGGTPGRLTANMTNPTGSPAGVLAGQMVALTLSLGFDRANPDFSKSDAFLGDLTAASGKCKDMNVGAILAAANNVIGGCSGMTFSPSEINECVDAVNNSYVDGTKNSGFLKK